MRAHFVKLAGGALVFSLCLSYGCATVSRTYNVPSQQNLRIESPSHHARYAVEVLQMTYPVSDDGSVTFDVPRLPRGSEIYLFGVIKLSDGSPKNVRAIHLKIGNRTIRKLSLNELAKLPIDDEGYRLLRVK